MQMDERGNKRELLQKLLYRRTEAHGKEVIIFEGFLNE